MSVVVLVVVPILVALVVTSVVIIGFTDVSSIWADFLGGCVVCAPVRIHELFFMCTLILVSAVVLVYARSYMALDRTAGRFFGSMLLFVISMIGLLVSDAFYLFFLFWELVGVCSFILIGFWSGRQASTWAGLKAVSVNRILDIVLFFLFIMISIRWDAHTFTACLSIHRPRSFDVVCSTGVLLVACGKSAQLGFHGWILSAMEGPTPVSALMHAATLVTAGVILLIKFSPCFGIISVSAFAVGAVTAVACGIAALVESDLKAIIAYSTCGQMGFAIILCAVGQYGFCMSHLSLHAVFKSAIFMAVGLYSHVYSKQYASQTTSAVRGFVFFVLFVCLVTLSGVPFLAGFYSKELLAASVMQYFPAGSDLVLLVSSIVAIVSSAYSIRIIVTVCAASRGQTAHTGGAGDVVYLLCVTLISIWFGWLLVVNMQNLLAFNLIGFSTTWMLSAAVCLFFYAVLSCFSCTKFMGFSSAVVYTLVSSFIIVTHCSLYVLASFMETLVLVCTRVLSTIFNIITNPVRSIRTRF